MDVKVVLYVVNKEVEANAALNVLNALDEYVNCFKSKVGGCEVVAGHLTCEVEDLAAVNLIQRELVSYAGLGLSYEYRAGGNGSNCVYKVVKRDCEGVLTLGDGCGKSVVKLFLGLLVYVDGNSLVILDDRNVLSLTGGNVNGPLDCIGGLTDCNNANEVVVHYNLAALALIHGSKVFFCEREIILGFYRFSAASCKCRQAKYKQEQASKNSFHD